MKAVYFDGSEAAVRHDYPRPGGGSDNKDSSASESIVNVTLAGICGTDIEILNGYMGYRGVIGHEFVGTVVESDDAAIIGKRVAGEINVGCNSCSMCSRGLQRHCAYRTVLGIQGRDGAFAQMLSLPRRNLHEVPDIITDRQAVFIEPLAAAFEIREQIPHVGAGWRAAIVGDGRLAQLVCQVLRTVCSSVTCFGRHPKKLRGLERFGIETRIGMEDGGGDMRAFDLVVDASGSASGFGDAMRLVRPRGTLVLKSTTASGGRTDLTQAIIDEVTIVGSRCGLFKPAIDALATGTISVSHMEDAVFALDEFGEAVLRAQEPDALKVCLDPQA